MHFTRPAWRSNYFQGIDLDDYKVSDVESLCWESRGEGGCPCLRQFSVSSCGELLSCRSLNFIYPYIRKYPYILSIMPLRRDPKTLDPKP